MYYCSGNCSFPCTSGSLDLCLDGSPCEVNNTCLTYSTPPSLQNHSNFNETNTMTHHISSVAVAGIVILVIGIVGIIIYVLYNKRSDYQRYMAERNIGHKGRIHEKLFSKLRNNDDPWNDEDDDNEVYF